MNNWFDYILLHTRTQPEKPAIVMEDRVVTYGMLRVGIERCTRRIMTLGITRGAPVGILVKNPSRHLTLCLALFKAGIPSISFERGQSGLTGITLAVVLGDEDAKTTVDPSHRFIEVTDEWFGSDPDSNSLPLGFSDGLQICRLCLTSGTTGQPKIIKLTVQEIGRLTTGFLGFNWNFLLCLPGLASSFGFTTACTTLATGRTLCFSESPFQSIRMIELFSIDFVMAATDQLLALTRVARTSGTDLRSLRTVEIAGNVPTRALLEAAIIYVCKNIFCRYGASETGLMARAYARNVLSRPGFAGHIMPGIEIAIVDRNGNLCPSGKVGLVRCRRHSRWDEPLSNGNRVERSWIDLGDVGWMTAEGELYILGRDADMTAVHLPGVEGQQVSPVHEVEHLLRLEWDATDAAAVIAGDSSDRAPPQIWIGIVDCKGVTKEDFEAILRSKGIDFEVRLFPMQSIPRAVNGKVNRSQLKSLMLASAG